MTSLEEKIGYSFKDRDLLIQALTHKSFSNENRKPRLGNNERLEFLGDAVLELVISDLLMKRFPEDSEGFLSRKRASLVNESKLADVARSFELEKKIFLGKGESQNRGSENNRILASVFEALVGAIYQEAGFGQALILLAEVFRSSLEALAEEGDFRLDFKTRLQERTQKLYQRTPFYLVVEESGPAHERQFVVEVRVGEAVVGRGAGRSKKQAEQEAARVALEKEAL